ncbi:MAG TPA: hypothetical protein VK629_10370 [Steroidobacteraceae bacterium]|nr:hypothetical protein [Steroidobacteraceae bacterium]
MAELGAGSFETEGLQGTGTTRCVAVSLVTATLMMLSWLNAVHSPAFDCIKASAMAMRSRRSLCANTLLAEYPAVSSQFAFAPKSKINQERS